MSRRKTRERANRRLQPWSLDSCSFRICRQVKLVHTNGLLVDQLLRKSGSFRGGRGRNTRTHILQRKMDVFFTTRCHKNSKPYVDLVDSTVRTKRNVQPSASIPLQNAAHIAPFHCLPDSMQSSPLRGGRVELYGDHNISTMSANRYCLPTRKIQIRFKHRLIMPIDEWFVRAKGKWKYNTRTRLYKI